MLDDSQSKLVPAVMAAMRADVLEAVEQLQAEAAAATARISPKCAVSGRCCRFEEYGHRLFTTTAELAAFAVRLKDDSARLPLMMALDGGGCRFQANGLCSVHLYRPLGCRLFFCDPATESRMQEVYEDLHGRVRQLHVDLGVEYLYVEWRVGLSALQQIITPRV